MIRKNVKRQTSDVRQELTLKLQRLLSHVSLLTFHLLCCGILLSCENDVEKVNATNERKADIEEGLKIESYLSEGGRQRAKLVAPYMLRYTMDTSYLEFPRSLHVNFFDSAGKVESQVDALYGKYLETQSKVFLRDSVVAFNVKGDTLRTPDLWWDQNTKKFYTDKVVRFKSASKIIYGGKGFTADQDLSHYTIFQPTGI
ncbi:MAG TPA: LPS export ABC transporter periplasmic protein LptC, partial [Flavisolibacter sp.]|nr:LPS export ABC transporter periplasmic protein LptC [Flavisolibacter sp.]